MAKKKKSKKHNFTYAKPGQPARSAQAPAQSQAERPTPQASKPVERKPAISTGPTAVAAYEGAHLAEIKADVRRVLVLAVAFVLFELALWFLLEHTGVGPHVYNLVKL